MPRRRKDIASLQAEIETRQKALAEAKARMREFESEEAARIGQLALKAGALDHDLSDEQWIALFRSGLASLGKPSAASAGTGAS